jgi:hypothetical protein
LIGEQKTTRLQHVQLFSSTGLVLRRSSKAFQKAIRYSLIGFKGFSVLDGFGMINHTRTTSPVVFLHRSSATKVIEGISKSLLAKA